MSDYNHKNRGKMDIENIPTELKDKKQWVSWEYRERNGKPAKVPINPADGSLAKINDSTTWGSFGSALLYTPSNEDDRIPRLGFVFTESDPYVGVDLDNCIDDEGEVSETAEAIISSLNTYTELSPSERGLHVLLKGNLPAGSNRRDNIEVYDQDRFFTVTGLLWSDTPATIEPRQKELTAFHADYVIETTNTEIITGGGDGSSTPQSRLSDEEVISKAMGAKHGKEFSLLWEGDTSQKKSHSEADQALCNRLAFWTAKDRDQIDRLFRQSGLMRSKWDESRGDKTYGEMTIDSAISFVDDTYDPRFGQKRNNDDSREKVVFSDVKETVLTQFDQQTWDVTEAILSAHVTLLLESQTAGIGLAVTGPSGSGKTTILKFFDQLDEMIYRSDDITSASFVSHDSSKNEEQLQEIDLLPRIANKTLLTRDMAPWFAGDQEAVRKRMSILAPLLDGDGYTRDTGTHGQRGYTGEEYRFNFIGATTPLSPRAWRVMGTVGNRLVFHEKLGNTDTGSVVDDVIDGSNYREKVERCRSIVSEFLRQIWEQRDEITQVPISPESDKDVRNLLEVLTNLIKYSRAPLVEDVPQYEGGHRIAQTLLSIARGHAIIRGQQSVTVDDMQVCGRIALSTMPSKRRPLIRALLDPNQPDQLIAEDIDAMLDVSRPTSIARMDELEKLGIGEVIRTGDGRNTKSIQLSDSLHWPDELDFPEF